MYCNFFPIYYFSPKYCIIITLFMAFAVRLTQVKNAYQSNSLRATWRRYLRENACFRRAMVSIQEIGHVLSSVH